MRKFSYKATTKNGFGKYCVDNNACTMTDFYRPNMKGGHRHNHVYNVCRKHVLRSKQMRKNVSRETKKELIRGFYLSLRIKHNFGEFLNKFFHNNKKDKK